MKDRRENPTGWNPHAAWRAAFVFAAVLAAYGPVYRAGFIWDDDAHVTGPALRPLNGLWRIWTEVGATQQYYPVLHSAFWIEHRLWGGAAFGYHLLNVLLHATAACLSALVLGRLSGRRGLAWLAALVFALHPVCVESVAWVSEQKNTLSAVFYLLAGLAYLEWREAAAPRRGFYWLATGLFVLALLTKSVTATLPAALLVALWWRRGRLSRRDVLPLLPWFAAAAGAGLFTAWVERRYIGAQGAEFALGFTQRCLLAGRAFWFYLAKLAWPSGFAFIYPRWNPDAGAAWQYLFPAGVAAVLAGAWLLARTGPRSRGPLAAVLFFGGTLFPALGFLDVYPFLFSYVADHFQYLAGLGIFALAAGTAGWLWTRLAVWGRAILAAAAVAAPVLSGVQTWRLCADYRDAETLYRATLARNPGAWLAHVNLGGILLEKGLTGEAESHYRAAERLEPGYPTTHFDLGRLLLQKGSPEAAIVEFGEALRLMPGDAQAHDNLGIALAETGLLREARAQFAEAARIQPGNPTVRFNLGVVLQGEGLMDEAARSFGEALRLRPDYPEARAALDRLRSLPGGTGPAGMAR